DRRAPSGIDSAACARLWFELDGWLCGCRCGPRLTGSPGVAARIRRRGHRRPDSGRSDGSGEIGARQEERGESPNPCADAAAARAVDFPNPGQRGTAREITRVFVGPRRAILTKLPVASE